MLPLLDVIAAPAMERFPLLFFAFLVVAILLEGWIIHKMMKQPFKTGLLWALLVNIVSLLIGFLLKNEIGNPARMDNFLIYFGLTLLIEWGALLAISKGKDWKRLSLTALLMNAASYLIMAILIWGFDAL